MLSVPIVVQSQININNTYEYRDIILHHGLTTIIGPNGSGKTHILRGLKNSLNQHVCGKRVRFISAGRMGTLEQYRSDYNGHRNGSPDYDSAHFGSKSDTARRHIIETINGDFQTLAERADIQIKVQERLRKLFKRDILIEWDGGHLRILFSRVDNNSAPYSSGKEASGLMHLVGILSALYDDEVGALLLDEPEVSLHPQLQAFLLNEILSVAGHPSEGGNKKLVVIATHSTEMLKINHAKDLLSLIFCHEIESAPIQIPSDIGELKNKKIQDLISRLGQEHKLSFFSKHPLLVEGPSDVIICSFLSNKLGLYLEAAGSQLLPVIGKGQISIVAKLFRLMGKIPTALADADGIADGIELINSYLIGNQEADRIAISKGASSATEMAKVIYNDFCKLIEESWPCIAELAQQHPYWVNKKSDVNELISKRRAAFCTLFTTSEEQLSTIQLGDSFIAIRDRFSALFNILEQCGLFILRKGSIESYYVNSDHLTSIGKPNAAVDEIEYLNTAQISDIILNYNDIVRCIQHASKAETICEAGALRDLLLAVLAPAHARLKSGETTTNFNTLARSILGDRSKIIGLACDNEKLVVSIESKILDISNFPISIGKDDDLLRSINTALALPN